MHIFKTLDGLCQYWLTLFRFSLYRTAPDNLILIDQLNERGNCLLTQSKDLKTMPVRQYLDNTVVPILLQAMTELAKER